jgi:hypothetical protein
MAKSSSTRLKKFKFLLSWVFLGPNSEYACVNFFAHILASLISRDFLFQLTQAENADVVANCDHLCGINGFGRNLGQ